MGKRLKKELQKVPIQFSLVVRVDSDFSEVDILPLADFVNESVERAKIEELPAELEFGGSEIVLRRYTVEVAPEPRIVIVWG